MTLWSNLGSDMLTESREKCVILNSKQHLSIFVFLLGACNQRELKYNKRSIISNSTSWSILLFGQKEK